MTKDELTNESVMKHFDNSFEVALYAIDIARRLIKTGKNMPLTELIEEIKKHPDQFEIEEPLDYEEQDA